MQGRSTVFFARPSMRGSDVAATRTRAADEFCRRVGLGGAVFFDQSEQSSRAVDLDGRYVGNAPVLRDVLCRR